MPPEYLFNASEKSWSTIKQRITAAGKIALLLDYDGTLTPICKNPSLAVLSEDIRALLESLSSIDNVTVVLVTGRSYSDIRKMVRLKNIIYVSNHGFQITWDKRRWVHPEIKKSIELLQGISILLKDTISQFYLTSLEYKKYTLSIHYRNEERANIPLIKKAIKNTVEVFLSSLKITRGKKVIEVRPRITWNKGFAVIRLLSILKKKTQADPLVIYIGDDKTDEDAFMMLPESAVTIRVGRGKKTKAKFYLNNVHETGKFLRIVKSERQLSQNIK